MREVFKGACTALITPMTEGGAVDYDAFARLIDFQLENGIDALLACGTTGEPPTLSEDERAGVIEFTVKRAAGRVPVLAGTGGNNTAAAVLAGKRAQNLGASALLVVTPYYNKATQGGLVAHYRAIAEGAELPVILYNVPGRTGVNLLPRTVEELCEVPNIAGLKEAGGNMEQICDAARRTAGKIALYSGDDSLNLPVLSVGGSGCISVLSNILPAQTHELCKLYFEGDTQGARQLFLSMFNLARAVFCEVNPIPIKAAAWLLGLCQPYLRLPLTPIEPQNLELLKREMLAFGLSINQ